MKFKDVRCFIEEMLILIFAIAFVCIAFIELEFIAIAITIPFAVLCIGIVSLILCISLFSRVLHLGFFSILDLVFQNLCTREYVFLEKQEIYSSKFVFRKNIEGREERPYYVMHFKKNNKNYTFITAYDIDLKSGKLYEVKFGVLSGVLISCTDAKTINIL